MEWTSALKDFVLPVGAATVGVLGMLFRFASRFAKVEEEVPKLAKGLQEAQAASKADHEAIRKELHEKIENLKCELKDADERLSDFRKSSVDFAKDAELARFIEEQQRQWNAIQRTLGQIEGALKVKS